MAETNIHTDNLSSNTNLELNTSFAEPAFNNWPRTPQSASDWFCLMFPDQARVYGGPFLEQRKTTELGVASIPLAPNIDFLAGCLGGDSRLGHCVIYYAPELEFYFLDPRDNLYYPTTPEKLGNLMRALLARCAAAIKGEALANLFYIFRSDKVIKAIVNRAKSILAADPEFFSSTSPNQRVHGPEIHERIARVFCEQILERESGHVLTISEAFTIFSEFAKQKNFPVIKRSIFKGLLGDVIRDRYGLGVRNDLIVGEGGAQKCGWKGLKAIEITA